MVKVRALPKFEGIRDLERNVMPKADDEWEVTEERANLLLQHGVVEIIEDKIIKEEIITEPIIEVEKESQRKPKEEKKSQRTSKK